MKSIRVYKCGHTATTADYMKGWVRASVEVGLLGNGVVRVEITEKTAMSEKGNKVTLEPSKAGNRYFVYYGKLNELVSEGIYLIAEDESDGNRVVFYSEDKID